MALRGDRVREIRERKGLTQQALADLCGITLYQVSRYETGKSDIHGTTLTLIAHYLDISTDYLLGLTDNPTGHMGESLFPDQKKLLEAYEAADAPTLLDLVSARLRHVAEKGNGG